MNSIDLDSYKKAWKNEAGFNERQLSEKEIEGFIKSSSTSINKAYRSGLLFDSIFKTILTIALLYLVFASPYQSSLLSTSVALLVVCGLGLLWQIRIIRKIPQPQDGKTSLLEHLHTAIQFYYQHYIGSIYVAALSGTLFFLIGSMYYLQSKYGKLPHFQTDDYIVMSIGIGLSFGLSAWVQLKQNNYRIKQLETRIREIEENTIEATSMYKMAIGRKNRILLFGFAFLVGLLLLLFLIVSFNS